MKDDESRLFEEEEAEEGDEEDEHRILGKSVMLEVLREGRNTAASPLAITRFKSKNVGLVIFNNLVHISRKISFSLTIIASEH